MPAAMIAATTQLAGQGVVACHGTYSEFEIGRGLKPELLSRYCTKTGSTYKVKDELRGLVSFGRQNLMESFASPGPFDIIFCRNVVIYFTAEARKDIFTRLSKALVPLRLPVCRFRRVAGRSGPFVCSASPLPFGLLSAQLAHASRARLGPVFRGGQNSAVRTRRAAESLRRATDDGAAGVFGGRVDARFFLAYARATCGCAATANSQFAPSRTGGRSSQFSKLHRTARRAWLICR